jgi:hypothetical protein
VHRRAHAVLNTTCTATTQTQAQAQSKLPSLHMSTQPPQCAKAQHLKAASVTQPGTCPTSHCSITKHNTGVPIKKMAPVTARGTHSTPGKPSKNGPLPPTCTVLEPTQHMPTVSPSGAQRHLCCSHLQQQHQRSSSSKSSKTHLKPQPPPEVEHWQYHCASRKNMHSRPRWASKTCDSAATHQGTHLCLDDVALVAAEPVALGDLQAAGEQQRSVMSAGTHHAGLCSIVQPTSWHYALILLPRLLHGP